MQLNDNEKSKTRMFSDPIAIRYEDLPLQTNAGQRHEFEYVILKRSRC
jgi:hypothetical protein